MSDLSTELARLASAASKSVPFASENLATALRNNLPAIIAALKAIETPLPDDVAGLVEAEKPCKNCGFLPEKAD